MGERFRLARAGDADALLGIYAPYVRDTTISFEETVPSPERFRDRVAGIAAVHPYLVHEVDGKIDGYAYASRQMEREAYRYNVDVSVYLSPASQGRGLGKSLYVKLFELLVALGYRNAYAGITQPNPRSERLHLAFGFTPVGTYHRTGYKFGKWLDVMWMEKRLSESEGDPGPLRRIGDLPGEFVADVLRR